MRPLRFVFNWIAILTLPVWGGWLLLLITWKERNLEHSHAVFTGRKWMGEL